jgi:hypothetical protein
MDRGFDVSGREIRGDFRTLPFDEQVQTIVGDLQGHFWHAQAQVVCNSFGSYLFLHTQAQMPSFPGHVLFCRPSWESSPTSKPEPASHRPDRNDLKL